MWRVGIEFVGPVGPDALNFYTVTGPLGLSTYQRTCGGLGAALLVGRHARLSRPAQLSLSRVLLFRTAAATPKLSAGTRQPRFPAAGSSHPFGPFVSLQ